MQRIMSTLKDRVNEAIKSAKNRGHDVQSIAKRCRISVQAVHAWGNPIIPLKGLKGDSLCGLAALSGFSPWYINDGTGMAINNEYSQSIQPCLSVREKLPPQALHQEVVQHLSMMDIDDQNVWLATITAASNKARKAIQEKSDRDSHKALDPPKNAMRTT